MEIEKYSHKWLLKNILESGDQHGRALMFIVEFQNHLMSGGENEFYTLLCALKTVLGFEIKQIGNRLMMYEQDLPIKITNEQYNKWYDTSEVVDGVRMGEVFIAS